MQSEQPGAMGLVAHRGRDARQPAIVAVLRQKLVETLVGGGPVEQLRALQSLLHFCRLALQRFGRGRGEFLRQAREQRCRHAFDGDQDVVDLADVVGGDRADQDAASRQHLHQALLLQTDDRLVHRRAAHAELARDLRLGRLMARREHIVADRRLQRLVGLVDQGGRLGCASALCARSAKTLPIALHGPAHCAGHNARASPRTC